MNKKLRGGLAVALLLAGTSAAKAQVSFGPRLGVNLASIAQDPKDDNDKVDTKLYPGGQIGLALNARFGSLAIQPAILLSQKGFKVDDSETANGATFRTEITQRMNYAEVPVNLVFTSGGEEGFQLFAGPYVGFGIGGKYDYKGTVSGGFGGGSFSKQGDVEFASKEGSDQNKTYVRALDLGLNAGVGLKTGPLQIQLGYGLGLSNLIPKDENDKESEDKLSNRVLQLSVGYFFE